jgi:hypothetical protein
LWCSFFIKKSNTMKKMLVLLSATILLGQPTHLAAQIIRSSVELKGPRAPAGSESKNGGKNESKNEKEAVLRHCCEKIVKAGQYIWFLRDRNGKMKFRVLGIYTHGATLFFLLRLNNRSSLDYDVDSIRFTVTRAGRAKSLSPGPGSLLPVYVYDSTVVVPGYRHATTIYVVPRFTLPPGRQLQIAVWERNGGRHLRVQTTNSVLERARLI